MRVMICGIAGFLLLSIPVTVWAGDQPISQPEHLSETTIISLNRGANLWRRPSYLVELHGDGSVTFEGQAYTLQKGAARYQIDPADVVKLYDFISERDFWSLKDKYAVNWTDQIYIEVCVTAAAQKKCVIDYSGENAGMPYAVREIENEIDRVGQTSPLIGKP